MGLYVYDRNTMETARPKQCVLRNLFVFIYFIDGIIMLSSGISVGDRVAETVVLSRNSAVNYRFSPAPSGRIAVIVIAVIVLWFAMVAGIVLLSLNSRKDSEEYRLAYEYLISSSAFAELNAGESGIFMNRYSSHTTRSYDGNSTEETVQIGFLVKARSFEVVCHREDGVWQVCEECTLFD